MSLKYIGKKNILVVEDDAFNIQLIRSILSKVSEMNIISSHDGANALSVLESGEDNIDMILLDIRMPIMNGEELLKRIRQNEKFDNVPVLIISVDKSNEKELRKIGANDFILKPFDIDDLVAKISTHFKYKK